jgi:hypothetical protein
MSRIVLYIAAFIVFMHGLVHLLYLVSYWPLAELEEVPYKTTLINGRWDVGPGGIRFYGFLSLLATLGFIVAAVGLAAEAEWWRSVMASLAVFSLVLTALDFSVAMVGPWSTSSSWLW